VHRARPVEQASRARRVIPDEATILARPESAKSKLLREHMSSVKATQLRPGMVIQHEGQLFTVFST